MMTKLVKLGIGIIVPIIRTIIDGTIIKIITLIIVIRTVPLVDTVAVILSRTIGVMAVITTVRTITRIPIRIQLRVIMVRMLVKPQYSKLATQMPIATTIKAAKTTTIPRIITIIMVIIIVTGEVTEEIITEG